MNTKKSPLSALRNSLTGLGNVTWNFPVMADLPTTSKEQPQQGSMAPWFIGYLSLDV
jgi:hypothetical protein